MTILSAAQAEIVTNPYGWITCVGGAPLTGVSKTKKTRTMNEEADNSTGPLPSRWSNHEIWLHRNQTIHNRQE